MTNVFSFKNVHPPVAPPDYFVGLKNNSPDISASASAPVADGASSITLTWDQTNIPANQTFHFQVDLWSSAFGWQTISDFHASGGQLPTDSGGGFLATDQTTIPSGTGTGRLCRLHVLSYGGWTLPTLAIDIQ